MIGWYSTSDQLETTASTTITTWFLPTWTHNVYYGLQVWLVGTLPATKPLPGSNRPSPWWLFSTLNFDRCVTALLPSIIQYRGPLKVGLISLQTTQILCIPLGPLKSWLDFTVDAMRCHHQESNALCSDLTRKRRGDPEETFGLSMLFILAV